MTNGTAPWFRMQAALLADRRMRRLGHYAAEAFIAALMIAKMNGSRDGVILKDELEPADIADLWMWDREGPDALRNACHGYGEGLAKLVKAGRLEEDATSYTVANWKRYQPDPTGADRQKRHREAKPKRGRNGPLRQSRRRDGTGRNGGESKTLSPPLLAAVSPAAAVKPPPPSQLGPIMSRLEALYHLNAITGAEMTSAQVKASIGKLDEADAIFRKNGQEGVNAR